MTDKEKVIWEAKPSQWINLKAYCRCIAMVLCVILAMIYYTGIKWWIFLLFLYPAARALSEWATLYFTEYKLTSDRFIYREGIFNRITRELKPSEIRDVRLVEPWYERIVRLGDIELIVNPYLNLSIKVRGISDAEKVCDLFKEILTQNKPKTD